MPTRPVWMILLALALFGAGWVARTLLQQPPPDVAALLRAADSVAGKRAQEREDSLRWSHRLDLSRDSAAADSALKAKQAEARRLKAKADSAARSTDAALAALEASGADVRTATLALEAERSAAEARRLADSSIAAQQVADLERRARLVIVERDRLYGRVDSLTHVVTGLRNGLKRVGSRGLAPAAAVTRRALGDGSSWTVSGTVQIPGTSWLRAGIHWNP